MTEFMTKLCCYGHKPIIGNVESDSDSDQFHIKIVNVLEEGEDREGEKVTTAYNSNDSDDEKEKTQKKTTFENDSDDNIPDSVSK